MRMLHASLMENIEHKTTSDSFSFHFQDNIFHLYIKYNKVQFCLTKTVK